MSKDSPRIQFNNAFGDAVPLQWHAVGGGLLLCLASLSAVAAPVSFTGSYSQNFNSLATTGTSSPWVNDSTLPGWSLFNKDGAVAAQIAVGTGSGNAGSFYSFGADANDRALGVLVSGGAYFGAPANNAVAGWMALALVNRSPATIDALKLLYNGEQWRNGGSADTLGMTLEWGLGTDFASVATWSDAGALFSWGTPVKGGTAAAVVGNTAGLVAGVGGDLRGLNWGVGQTLWLRWVQKRINSGSGHGLSIDDLTIAVAGTDTTAPELQTSVPANNATAVSMGTSSFTLTFSEGVQAGNGSFELRAGAAVLATMAAADTAKVTISGQTVTLKPGVQLAANTAYSIVPVDTPIQDTAGNLWSVSTIGFMTGGLPAVTRIHAIQGSGETAALALGSAVTINGVVTSYVPGLSGFYVQEEEANYDADAGTSEGIFVYYGASNPGVDASSVGKRVFLTGVVDEYNKQTQLKNLSLFQLQGAGVLPAPVPLTLPISDHALWERYEGMLVQLSSATSGGKLVVSDNYTLGRYGDVTLSPDAILPQFAELNAPSQSGYAAYAKTMQRSQIILDDNSSKSNPDAVRGRNGQPLSAGNTLRAGDAVSAVVGVLDQFYQTSAPPEIYQTSYRVQPTQPVSFAGAARPTAADFKAAVGAANLKVASANVLNFFSQVGDTSTTTKDVFTPPAAGSAPIGIRGANTLTELDRQKAKVVANLIGLDADVYGLMEVQNNGYDATSAIKLLVDAMNASADKPSGAVYDFVKAPFNQGGSATMAGAGSDAITVAIVYRTDRVKSVGAAAVPNVATYDAFTQNGGGARVPIAQTFSAQTPAGEQQFTLVVNHFKSKGSVLSTGGNADILDGQGANNPARLKTATQLNNWLATKPTGVDTTNVILVGDFNAYAKEDPVTYLEANGFAKVSKGYSYSFDGLWGSLDHIFVSTTLTSKVGNAVKWAINAEEPTALDYNQEFKSTEQIASYYAATAYRSSDHNPIVLGLNFPAPPVVNKAPLIIGVPGATTQIVVGKTQSLAGLSVSDADGDALTLTLNVVNGQLQGVVDADAQLPGTQLKGTAAQIGTALAAANFAPTAQGAASIQLSLKDGVNAAVTASYAFNVTAAPPVGLGSNFDLSASGNVSVKGQLAGANCQLASPPKYVTAASLGITQMPSQGATLPHGLLVLNAIGCDKGGELTVTMTYPQALPDGAQIKKWGRTADNLVKHWYTIPATVKGNVATFTIKDGGLGDDDLQADGNIADPTALVLPAVVTPPVPATAAPVPTLSVWGLLLLALSFLPFGARFAGAARKR